MVPSRSPFFYSIQAFLFYVLFMFNVYMQPYVYDRPLTPPTFYSNHYNVDLDGETVPDFASILKKAPSLIETRKKMVKLGPPMLRMIGRVIW